MQFHKLNMKKEFINIFKNGFGETKNQFQFFMQEFFGQVGAG